jgi:hypothetical protein
MANIVGGNNFTGPTQLQALQQGSQNITQAIQFGRQLGFQMDEAAWKRLQDDPWIQSVGLNQALKISPDYVKGLATGRVMRRLGDGSDMPVGTQEQLENAGGYGYITSQIGPGQLAPTPQVPRQDVNYIAGPRQETAPAPDPTVSSVTPTTTPGGLNEPELKALEGYAYRTAESNIQYYEDPQTGRALYWYMPPGVEPRGRLAGRGLPDIPGNAVVSYVEPTSTMRGVPELSDKAEKKAAAYADIFEKARSAYRSAISESLASGDPDARTHWDAIQSRIATEASAIDERQVRAQKTGALVPEGGYTSAPPAVARSYEEAYGAAALPPPAPTKRAFPYTIGSVGPDGQVIRNQADLLRVRAAWEASEAARLSSAPAGTPSPASAPTATLGDLERSSLKQFILAWQRSTPERPATWSKDISEANAWDEAKLRSAAPELAKEWDAYRAGTVPAWASGNTPSTSSASSSPTTTLVSGRESALAKRGVGVPTAKDAGMTMDAATLSTAYSETATPRDRAEAKRLVSAASASAGSEARRLWRTTDTVTAGQESFWSNMASIAQRMDTGGELASHPMLTRALRNFEEQKYDKGEADISFTLAQAGLTREQTRLYSAEIAAKYITAEAESIVAQSEALQKILPQYTTVFTTLFKPSLDKATTPEEVGKIMQNPTFKAFFEDFMNTLGASGEMKKYFEVMVKERPRVFFGIFSGGKDVVPQFVGAGDEASALGVAPGGLSEDEIARYEQLYGTK